MDPADFKRMRERYAQLVDLAPELQLAALNELELPAEMRDELQGLLQHKSSIPIPSLCWR